MGFLDSLEIFDSAEFLNSLEFLDSLVLFGLLWYGLVGIGRDMYELVWIGMV